MKSKRSREIIETKHKIYAIFSNGDNKFRKCNSLSEDKEKSFRDIRSINRGRCVDSHSGPMMINVLTYLLAHEIEHDSFSEAMGLLYSDLLDLENSLGSKR